MMRFFPLSHVLFAAGAIALTSSWLASSSATACEAAPPVGPEVSIGGAPSFIWPVTGFLVTDMCADGPERRFKGIDIATPEGTPVRAAADGVVAYAGDEFKDFGNVVLVRHDGGWVTAYAYLSRLLVKRGNVVTQGRPVALSGRSAALGTAVLHFEIRKQSSPVDPLRLLPLR